MPNRRDIVKGTGSTLALSLVGAKAGLAASKANTLPALRDVDFISSSTPEGRRLAMAFSQRMQKVPELRAVCRTNYAVAETVKWARDTNRKFAVRSSGHSFAGHSMHDDLVIDTSRLNQIEFSPNKNHVAVSAGTFNGSVYETLAVSQHALGGGSYGSVCMAGITLGGGVGYRSRISGLLCDQLDEIMLINADGNIVRANHTENADLFWASRGGGGGSFGIVTNLKFRTTPTPTRNLIYVHIAVTFRHAQRILHDWQHWLGEMGRTTTTHLQMARYSKNRFLVALTGESTLSRNSVLSALQKLLGPNVVIHENYLVNYYSPHGLNLMKNWDAFLQPVKFISKSDYVNAPVPSPVITNVLETLKRHPPATVKLTFEALSGAVQDIAIDETAYAHRGALYLLEYRSEYRLDQQMEPRRQALNEIRAIFRPHVTGGAYVNYADPELDNWAQAYWGSNLPRLVETKQKWDPDNVFNHAQSIPLG